MFHIAEDPCNTKVRWGSCSGPHSLPSQPLCIEETWQRRVLRPCSLIPFSSDRNHRSLGTWLTAGLVRIGSRKARRNILLCQKVKEVLILPPQNKNKTKMKACHKDTNTSLQGLPTDQFLDDLSMKKIKDSNQLQAIGGRTGIHEFT